MRRDCAIEGIWYGVGDGSDVEEYRSGRRPERRNRGEVGRRALVGRCLERGRFRGVVVSP